MDAATARQRRRQGRRCKIASMAAKKSKTTASTAQPRKASSVEKAARPGRARRGGIKGEAAGPGTAKPKRPPAADGLPPPVRALTPNQTVLRRAVVRFFDSSCATAATALRCSRMTIHNGVVGDADPNRRLLERLATVTGASWELLMARK